MLLDQGLSLHFGQGLAALRKLKNPRCIVGALDMVLNREMRKRVKRRPNETQRRHTPFIGEGMVVGSLVKFEQGLTVLGYSPSASPLGHTTAVQRSGGVQPVVSVPTSTTAIDPQQNPLAPRTALSSLLVPLSVVFCLLSVGATSSGSWPG